MLLNFKSRFIEPIRAGTKDQTIRHERKDCYRPKVGETLYLYSGARTKNCVKIGEAICSECMDIKITDRTSGFTRSPDGIWLNGDHLSEEETVALVIRDGFNHVDSFYRLFRSMHEFPFEGFVVRWKDFKPA